MFVEWRRCYLGKNSGKNRPDVKMNDQSTAQSTPATQSSVDTFQEHLATVLSMFTSKRQVINFNFGMCIDFFKYWCFVLHF